MADLGTITLGNPVNVGLATQVQRNLSVSTDPVTKKVMVAIRACLCDANDKMLGNPSNYVSAFDQLPPAAQTALTTAMTACYDAANVANPTGFPK